ncbi:MAG: ABC transporter permease [Nitrospirota bacterium]|nr:ABC transporter permease [Nitrospirota bacterium]
MNGKITTTDWSLIKSSEETLADPIIRDLRGIYTLWLRDVIRLWRDRIRLVGSFIQPLLFLFILGGGLSPRLGSISQGVNGGSLGYQAFLFPGIVGMSVLFTASFAGVAIVWDREVGFLKEVLVAPLSRTAVVIGKILGGATNSVLQGGMILVLYPLFHLRPSSLQLVSAFFVMLLIGLTQTAVGILLGVRMTSSQGFMVLMNFIILPLFFLSGALYPLDRLPHWLSIASRLDPMTYGVDLLRHALAGIHYYSVTTDLLTLIFFLSAMSMLSVHLFNRAD